jgi:hypothetical protein
MLNSRRAPKTAIRPGFKARHDADVGKTRQSAPTLALYDPDWVPQARENSPNRGRTADEYGLSTAQPQNSLQNQGFDAIC